MCTCREWDLQAVLLPVGALRRPICLQAAMTAGERRYMSVSQRDMLLAVGTGKGLPYPGNPRHRASRATLTRADV